MCCRPALCASQHNQPGEAHTRHRGQPACRCRGGGRRLAACALRLMAIRSGDGSEDVEVCVDRRVRERLALGWATCTLVASATDDEERASSHFASRARITFWSRWQEDATRTFEAKTRNRIVRRVLITWSSRALVRATRKWINAYMAREMRLQHLELAEAAHMHLFVARWAKLARPRRLLADYIARAVWRRKRQRLKGAVRVWRRLRTRHLARRDAVAALSIALVLRVGFMELRWLLHRRTAAKRLILSGLRLFASWRFWRAVCTCLLRRNETRMLLRLGDCQHARSRAQWAWKRWVARLIRRAWAWRRRAVADTHRKRFVSLQTARSLRHAWRFCMLVGEVRAMDKIARNHAKTSRRLEWRRWRKAVGVRLRLHRMRSIARGACANWRMERGWRVLAFDLSIERRDGWNASPWLRALGRV